jgi:hypothetical protein
MYRKCLGTAEVAGRGQEGGPSDEHTCCRLEHHDWTGHHRLSAVRNTNIISLFGVQTLPGCGHVVNVLRPLGV